jgi:molecular chaperone DnaK
LLDENGDKIPEDVKTPVVDAIAKLKEALNGTDNDDEVQAARDDLNQKASAMGQAIYAAAQAQQQSAPADDASSESSSSDDDVVDAEIIDEEPKND